MSGMNGVVPVNATVTVATAATRVQVNANAPTVVSVYFEALKTNTGNIYVGVSDVTSTKYIACLTAGQGFNLSNGGGQGPAGGEIKLSSLYVDCSVSGEKVQVTYLTRVGP